MVTNEEFDALVLKLEDHARKDPAGYRIRVALLAFLGNAYLAIVLLVVGLLFLLSLASILQLKVIGVKIAVVTGIFLWILIRALWIKLLPPQGFEVTRGKSPELFTIVDDLRQKLGAPPFHHVLATDEFNAGVVQAPRAGIFGWPRNYLLIGLPLMKSVTVEQFRAVLAHEFGHLAKSHGRMSNWIYRQRLRWSRLVDALDASESQGGFLFKPFFNWYSPYFSAYSFPLARANEYEADATSVRLTSKMAAAEALTSVNVVGAYLNERYWPEVHKHADDTPRPGFAPFSGMGHHVATNIDEASTQTWIDRALAQKTTSADTHPALCDRLQAIGETPRLTRPQPGEGADRLLGNALETITDFFDKRWQENILPAWQQRYRAVQESRRRLAKLDELHATGKELSVEEAYERAKLTISFGNDQEGAIEQFRVLVERAPENALARFGLGAGLLARKDHSGVAFIERAIKLDEELSCPGYAALRDYCWSTDRQDEAHVWNKRLVERAELEQAALSERNRISIDDKFDLPHLAEAVIVHLRTQLRAIPGLRKAYFVNKRVAHLPHHICYVLAFGVTGLFQIHSRMRAAEVLKKIRETVQFPGHTRIVNIEGANYRLGKRFRGMKWSRIV